MSLVTVIQPQEHQENKIVKFNLTEAQLSELNAQCLTLKIKDADDTKGYEEVRISKAKLVDLRVDIENRRLELARKILAEKKDVDEVAGRLTNLIAPAETHLSNEKARIDKILAERKLEREKQRNERFEKRIHELIANGCSFEEGNYVVGEVSISSADARKCDDKKFKAFIKLADKENWKIKARIASEKAAAAKEVIEPEVIPVQTILQTTSEQCAGGVSVSQVEPESIIINEQLEQEPVTESVQETATNDDLKEEAELLNSFTVESNVVDEKALLLKLSDALNAIEIPYMINADTKRVTDNVVKGIKDLVNYINVEVAVIFC